MPRNVDAADAFVLLLALSSSSQLNEAGQSLG